jgi:hypothetical protein
VLPMPHIASSTSDGFDQHRRAESQWTVDAEPAKQVVHRSDAGLEDVDESTPATVGISAGR